MKNISIKVKLLGAFAIILVAVAALGAFCVRKLSAIDGEAAILADEWLPGVQVSADINSETGDIRTAQAVHIFATAPDDQAKIEKNIADLNSKVSDSLKKYESLINSDQEKEVFGKVRSTWQGYMDQAQEMMKLSRANQDEQAIVLYRGKMQELYDQNGEAIDELIKINVEGSAAAKKSGDEVYASSRMIIIVAVVATVVMALGIGYLLVRAVSVPVLRMAIAMKALAGGDRQVKIVGFGQRDEIGMIADAFEVMRAVAIKADAYEQECEELRETTE
ncbi:MAG: MCP four helix bundle domain-containing protein, partial [Alphaproteobacteria bacterium]